MTAGQESLSLLAGGQIHRPANASHGCNLPAKRRCEKWRRLRRRHLGGCGREAAVHGPLLMAGGARAIGMMGKRCEPEVLGCKAALREVVALATARRLRS